MKNYSIRLYEPPHSTLLILHKLESLSFSELNLHGLAQQLSKAFFLSILRSTRVWRLDFPDKSIVTLSLVLPKRVLHNFLPNASDDPLTPSPYNLLQGNPKFPSFGKVGKIEVLVERYLYFKKETWEMRPSVNPSIQDWVSIRYMVKYRRGQGGILK